MYTLGFALVPLVTASFSEEFGRQPLYIVSALGFALMHLMIAEFVYPYFKPAPLLISVFLGLRISTQCKLPVSFRGPLAPLAPPW